MGGNIHVHDIMVLKFNKADRKVTGKVELVGNFVTGEVE